MYELLGTIKARRLQISLRTMNGWVDRRVKFTTDGLKFFSNTFMVTLKYLSVEFLGIVSQHITAGKGFSPMNSSFDSGLI